MQKTFKPVQITTHGKDVTVETEHMAAPTPEHAPAIKVRATCGEVVVEMSTTLAPTDGALALPREGQIQADINKLREAAAKAAAHRAAILEQLNAAM